MRNMTTKTMMKSLPECQYVCLNEALTARREDGEQERDKEGREYMETYTTPIITGMPVFCH